MSTEGLGKPYARGRLIVKQGEPGDCLYVIQSGRVEVIREEDSGEVRLAELGEGDFFGEVPLFERMERSASVRAPTEVRVLTVDRRTLMSRIAEDPSLAFRILETLSRRVREMDAEVARLQVRLLEAHAEAGEPTKIPQ